MKETKLTRYLQNSLPCIQFASSRNSSEWNRTFEHIHEEQFQLTMGWGAEGVLSVGNQHFQVETNTVFVIQPGELHGLNDENNRTFANMTCRFALPGYEGKLLSRKITLPDETAKQVQDLFFSLCARADSNSVYDQIRARLILVELLLLLEEQGEADTEGILRGPLASAREYMLKNFKTTINIEDVAAVAKISQEHLCRLFSQKLGSTPLVYLQQLRLGYALERLFTSKQKLGSIAAESGFTNLKTFNAAFQKHYNCSASEYRKLYLEKNGSA